MLYDLTPLVYNDSYDKIKALATRNLLRLSNMESLMKNRKERSKISSEQDIAFEHEIHELADAITECETTIEDVPLLVDPFEDYLNSLRGKFFSNPNMFRSRLAKGYHILLHEIENPHSPDKQN